MESISRGVGIVSSILFLSVGLFYNTPFQTIGVIFPVILFVLTIIQMFVIKKIANKFLEDSNPSNRGYEEYYKYPKMIQTALISTVIVFILILLSLTVFSTDIDLFDEYSGLMFNLLDSGWVVMNYVGLPFFHFGAITMGGLGISNFKKGDFTK